MMGARNNVGIITSRGIGVIADDQIVPAIARRYGGPRLISTVQIDPIIRIIRGKGGEVTIRQHLAGIAAIRDFIGRPRHQGGDIVLVAQDGVRLNAGRRQDQND